MKGGQSSRFWGRHSSLTLAALFLTTIFFWSWENNPLLTSLLSAQEQFLMHTSGNYICLGLWFLLFYTLKAEKANPCHHEIDNKH